MMLCVEYEVSQLVTSMVYDYLCSGYTLFRARLASTTGTKEERGSACLGEPHAQVNTFGSKDWRIMAIRNRGWKKIQNVCVGS